jgi:acyl carrier protein
MINVETIENGVREILSSMFSNADIYTIELEDQLENKLGIDSLKVLQLIVELETKFNVEVDDNDLLLENFATINKIITIINRLTA